ncbi:unnamed protein product [Strongylus vulgaris]|uniref:Uncharacterized protein n=1 Tax=Strongylus vulgaris TaxID=40348 RepID=A0A3P7LVA7_STRVU|nr:unnamed protein product [Strongylus vulgaris]
MHSYIVAERKILTKFVLFQQFFFEIVPNSVIRRSPIELVHSSNFQVAHFADQVKSRFPDLNVLLCNAGVLNPRRAETKDGLEMTFQVNLFTNL